MFSINFSKLNKPAVAELASTRLTEQLELWEKEIWEFILKWLDAEIKAINIYTSGSTGKPKCIEHTKAAIRQSALLTCQALHIQSGDSALLCLPANKISGMMMLVRSIECGLNLYCIKPSTTPLALLDSNSNFDFAAFTPMQFYAITDKTCFEKAQRISKIILGGEDISSALLNLIQQLSSSVYATFGMTETISHIALKKLNGNKPDKHYKTLSGIEINADEVGRLRIHAPSLLPTDLLTNDEVRIISKHEFDWLGRTDNVINSGGIKIHPEIAEQKLHAFIPYNFFIAGEENSITGKSVALVIEKESLNDIELGGIKESLFRLEKHERPRAILLSSPFIKTENGKLNRTKTIKNVSKRMEL